MQSDIGLIGLAVMGENLVMNMASRGYTVSVYNRSVEKVDRFLEGRAKGKSIVGARSLEELLSQIRKPRAVFLMIKAGTPVDDMITQLLPLLEEGDIVIDGGNSNYQDTQRRYEELKARGIRYVGSGVSGGELGALLGPSIMPGGDGEAWPRVSGILQAIAARADDGLSCCDWIGSGGAGHYVKMVHNGIEYGDMQLICEAYDIMRNLLGMEAFEMAEVFSRWNREELSSYLIGITADILAYPDEDGKPLVDKILDTAGQKGTGKWTVHSALDEGTALTLIGEAVFARCLSAVKEKRVRASAVLKGPPVQKAGREDILPKIKKALYAAKVVSYAQGFELLRSASGTYGWDLRFGRIAQLWRGGCIIRSSFLNDIAAAFEQDPDLSNLLLDSRFSEVLNESHEDWRSVCASAITAGIPVPAMTAALSYYDSYRTANLPANLLQAQRDYFGAHTYERTDKPRGEFFHTNWTGEGGETASSAYVV